MEISPMESQNRSGTISCQGSHPPYDLYDYLELEDETWHELYFDDKLFIFEKIFEVDNFSRAWAPQIQGSTKEKCVFLKIEKISKWRVTRTRVNFFKIFHARARIHPIFLQNIFWGARANIHARVQIQKSLPPLSKKKAFFQNFKSW